MLGDKQGGLPLQAEPAAQIAVASEALVCSQPCTCVPGARVETCAVEAVAGFLASLRHALAHPAPLPLPTRSCSCCSPTASSPTSWWSSAWP